MIHCICVWNCQRIHKRLKKKTLEYLILEPHNSVTSKQVPPLHMWHLSPPIPTSLNLAGTAVTHPNSKAWPGHSFNICTSNCNSLVLQWHHHKQCLLSNKHWRMLTALPPAAKCCSWLCRLTDDVSLHLTAVGPHSHLLSIAMIISSYNWSPSSTHLSSLRLSLLIFEWWQCPPSPIPTQSLQCLA